MNPAAAGDHMCCMGLDFRTPAFTLKDWGPAEPKKAPLSRSDSCAGGSFVQPPSNRWLYYRLHLGLVPVLVLVVSSAFFVVSSISSSRRRSRRHSSSSHSLPKARQASNKHPGWVVGS